MNGLKGRAALITGVSRKTGIGFGIAKRLAAMGADLFLHSYAPYDRTFPSIAVRSKMPLGRWGEPDDAARLISWLVSDKARWITGQVINSEGGFRGN